MKKIFISSLLLFVSYLTQAQLSYTSSCGANVYTTENTPYPLVSTASPFTADAGTNIYGFNFYSSPVVLSFRIFRSNNHWTIAGAYNSDKTIQFVSTDYSTEPNPPCNGFWEKYTDNVGTGQLCQIIITGTTCVPASDPNTNYFEALPNLVQIPRMTTPAIAQVPNPKRGMMVYDVTANCLKVYDNDSWECLGYQNRVATGTSYPANPQEGMIFYNSASRIFYGYTGSGGWVSLH